jgi:EmrB/QacA subfamily drug resistance transporter
VGATGLPAATPPDESASERWFAFAAVILGTFVTVLNTSLINVAIPKLINTFGSTPDRIQWVITGYMLASGVIIPITGFMGERFGYKKFLIMALTVFLLGTLLSAMAWSDTSLIFARIIAGIGGGVIAPISMALVYRLMPREQIGTALGVWGVSVMVAPAIGPTLSGYLIEWMDWRFLFIICIPVIVLAILMAWLLLKETETVKGKPFDIWGFVLSATSAGTLLYALSSGQKDGWTSFEIVSLIFISIASCALLVWVETGKEQPLIPLGLFKNVTYTLSVIAASLVTIGLYGGVFLMPIYLQNIQGMEAIDTGLMLMPASILMALAMMIAGRLFDKFGAIPLGLAGLSLLAVGTYELHALTVDTPHEWVKAIYIVRCIGIGLCMMPLSTAGMNAIAADDPRQVGNASALSNVIRQVASSFGIAILTMIMQDRSAMYARYIADAVTVTSNSTYPVFRGAQGLSQLSGLIMQDATTRGIADAFLLSSIPVFLAIPLVLFFRKPAPAKAKGQ